MTNRFYEERVLRSLEREKTLGTVVILNGPPGVGKDTIAEHLSRMTLLEVDMFKSSLYEATAKYFDVPLRDFTMRATDREQKELPWDALVLQLGGSWGGENGNWAVMMSPREALIFVSERVYKPLFGADYFGHAAVQLAKEGGVLDIVYSDGGFPDETQVIKDNCEKLFIIHLIRPGYTFEGDSRDYIQGFEADTHQVHLKEGDPLNAVGKIKEITGL